MKCFLLIINYIYDEMERIINRDLSFDEWRIFFDIMLIIFMLLKPSLCFLYDQHVLRIWKIPQEPTEDQSSHNHCHLSTIMNFIDYLHIRNLLNKVQIVPISFYLLMSRYLIDQILISSHPNVILLLHDNLLLI